MTAVLVVGYIVGVFLFAGFVAAAGWSWSELGPLPLLAGMFWPVVAPALLATLFFQWAFRAQAARVAARKRQAAELQKYLEKEGLDL